MFILFHRIIVTVANRMEKDTETVRLAKVETLLSCFYYVQRTSYYDFINFPPLKRGVLTREGGLFERGGLNRGFLVINRQQNSLPCCDSCEL